MPGSFEGSRRWPDVWFLSLEDRLHLTGDLGGSRAEVLALASIHRANRGERGVAAQKVPPELGRWELIRLPRPGPGRHLLDAIVARSAEDLRIL